MSVARTLQPFGETIFAEISRLAQHHDAINLGQGFPNFDGPDFIKQAAIDAITAGENQYARSVGDPVLSYAIADHFQSRYALSIDPNAQVTVTSGCTEAIAASLLGLLNPDDRVIVFEPFYDSYRACLAMAHAIPVFITLRAPDFTFDASALRCAFEHERPRAILLNTPHNPTGKVFSRAELELIASLCIEHDVIAITDEVYEHLVFDGKHIPLATLPGMWDRTITMSSLGKTFSLTGWKIGWAIAPEHLSATVRSAHQFLTFATATPLQHGAAAALRAPQSYFAEFRASYRERRDILIRGLQDVGFSVHAPAGTYFAMADHRPFGFEDDVAFCKHLIEHIGVAAIPPSAFYVQSNEGRHHVRFAFCKDREMLHTAVDRLRRLQTG